MQPRLLTSDVRCDRSLQSFSRYPRPHGRDKGKNIDFSQFKIAIQPKIIYKIRLIFANVFESVSTVLHFRAGDRADNLFMLFYKDVDYMTDFRFVSFKMW